MLISNSSNNNFDQYNNSTLKTPAVSLVSNSFNVSFCSRVKTKQVNFAFSHGLNKLKTFSPEEYKSLLPEEIKALRKEYEKLLKQNPIDYSRSEQMHSKTANCIRQTLDNKYGKDKYVVITIGRSLSSIGKVLGYQIGEENVINLPMSQAGKFLLERYVKSIEADGDIEVLRRTLAKRGLTKDTIQKSGKQYILMDYCCSGESLRGAKELLTRFDVLGDKHIRSMDVAKCVKDKVHAEALSADLFRCEYKDFSFVHEAHSIPEMQSAFVRPEKADINTKLFWFKLLDNEMQKPKKQQLSIWDRVRSFFHK